MANRTQADNAALKLAEQIHEALFSGAEKVEIHNITFPVKHYLANPCRAVLLGEYLYITQNTDKDSKWAEAARAGSKISWLIHTRTNKYLARVQDGLLTKL